MANGFIALVGLFVLYAPIALIALVIGMAAYVRIMPRLHPKA